MTGASRYDFAVIGAGSAGCAVAAGLAEREAGSVLMIEAGPSDRTRLVKMPFELVWLMGSKHRDWCFTSTPQANLNGRRLNIPRGRMLGGSGSINFIVWFRGRADDFDHWSVPGWDWADVEPAFEEVEARLTPDRLAAPHPVTEALSTMFRANDPQQRPSPERESAGVFRYNMRGGRRPASLAVAGQGHLRLAHCRRRGLLYRRWRHHASRDLRQYKCALDDDRPPRRPDDRSGRVTREGHHR